MKRYQDKNQNISISMVINRVSAVIFYSDFIKSSTIKWMYVFSQYFFISFTIWTDSILFFFHTNQQGNFFCCMNVDNKWLITFSIHVQSHVVDLNPGLLNLLPCIIWSTSEVFLLSRGWRLPITSYKLL